MAYLASPLDLLPDPIPYVGMLDDMGIIGAVGYFWPRSSRVADPVSVVSSKAELAVRPDASTVATRVAVGAVAKALKMSDANRDKLYVYVEQKVWEATR